MSRSGNPPPANAHLLLCNGAAGTTGREFWPRVRPERLWTTPGMSNVRLRVSQLSDRLCAQLSPRVLDLVEIAALVYAADQMFPRLAPGARFDYGDQWRRRLRFEVAVRDPDFWMGADLAGPLDGTLSFLSDDHYEFGFVPLVDPPGQQTYFDLTGDGPPDRPDRVALFSAGLDSTAGAVEDIVVHRRRLALVSHKPVEHMGDRQRQLVEVLRGIGGGGQAVWPQHYQVEVNKSGWDAADVTQRTRSFLFASLAMAVADVHGLDAVHFYENGIVSINLPLCAQEVGGRATRTTHPRVLDGFARLFTSVLDRPFAVRNEYLWKTKQDVLDGLKGAGFAHLARTAVSCRHTRDHTQPKPHCGRCSQCFSRRFAAVGAGYGADDPAEGYRLDVMQDAMPEDVDRTLAERWVGSARRLAGMATVQQFRQAFAGELARACPYVAPSPDDALANLFDLHKRFARQTTAVLEAEVRNLIGSLWAGQVPAGSTMRYAYNLAALAGTAAVPNLESTAEDVPSVVLQGADRPVLVMGEEKALTSDRYAVIEALVNAGAAGLSKDDLEDVRASGREILKALILDATWAAVIQMPGRRGGRYRVAG